MTFSALLSVVRRHLRTGLVVAATVCLVVVSATLLRPVPVQASAMVQVYPVAGGRLGPNADTDPVDTDTEVGSVTSAAVLERAAGTLEGTSVADLAGSVSAEAPERSQTLTIRSRARDAATATGRVNAVAQAYLHVRGEEAGALVAGAVKRLQKLSEGAGEGEPLSGAWNYLATERAKLEQLNVSPGRVIEAAAAEPRSKLAAVAIGGASGLASGLLAGLGATLLVERCSRKVLDAERLCQVTGADVIDWDDPRESARWLVGRLAEDGRDSNLILVGGHPAAVAQTVAGLEEIARERGKPAETMRVFRAADVDVGITASRLLRHSLGRPVLARFDAGLGGARLAFLTRTLGSQAKVVLAYTQDSSVEDCVSLCTEIRRAGGGGMPRLVFVGSPRPVSPPEEPEPRSAGGAIRRVISTESVTDHHGHSEPTLEKEAG